MDPESRRQRAETAAAIALAKVVHDARVAAGLTEAELATRAGLTEDAVLCIEESGTTPTPDLLNRLARPLDSDVTLTWTGDGVTATFAPHAPDRRPPARCAARSKCSVSSFTGTSVRTRVSRFVPWFTCSGHRVGDRFDGAVRDTRAGYACVAGHQRHVVELCQGDV